MLALVLLACSVGNQVLPINFAEPRTVLAESCDFEELEGYMKITVHLYGKGTDIDPSQSRTVHGQGDGLGSLLYTFEAEFLTGKESYYLYYSGYDLIGAPAGEMVVVLDKNLRRNMKPGTTAKVPAFDRDGFANFNDPPKAPGVRVKDEFEVSYDDLRFGNVCRDATQLVAPQYRGEVEIWDGRKAHHYSAHIESEDVSDVFDGDQAALIEYWVGEEGEMMRMKLYAEDYSGSGFIVDVEQSDEPRPFSTPEAWANTE